MFRLSGILARSRSEIQEATKEWQATRVDETSRLKWVRGHTRVAIPAHASSCEEHVRINEMLAIEGPSSLYERALAEPRTLAAKLGLQRLQLQTSGGLLRIRDVTTAEICLEWHPPRRTTARPSTDPSDEASHAMDPLTTRLQNEEVDDG